MNFELESFNRDVPDDRLLANLKAAYSELTAAGKVLTFRAYRDVGQFHPSTIIARFGSWNDALQRAGLPVNEEKGVSIEALFDNLKVVWIAKGRQPVYRDMNSPPSEYTASTYNARFGGWRRALEEFVAGLGEEERLMVSHAQRPVNPEIAATPRQPSLALRFLVLKRDRFRCTVCGRSPASSPGLELEIDHIQPWSKGGRTVRENLQALCFDCNRGKGET